MTKFVTALHKNINVFYINCSVHKMPQILKRSSTFVEIASNYLNVC